MNSLIELHDSTMANVSIQDEIVVVDFAPAYLHISKGRPGIDAGSGWNQEATMTFLSAETQGSLPELPATVSDGELIIGEQRFWNYLPLPLNTFSAASLRLLFDRFHSFSISGKGVRLELIGQPKYVEEFPGHATDAL